MPNLPLDLTNLALIVTLIIILLLYLREYNKRKKLESEGDKFLQGIKEKGWENLHQSIKKSQEILGEAELEGIKVVAGSEVELSKLENEYSKRLSQSLETSQRNIDKAQEKLMQFMTDLQKSSAQFEEASKVSGQERINQLFDNIENRLSDFLVQTAQKTSSSIELELKSSRQLIDTYKNEQLKLIDENIIAMMEQTLSLVLGKKLSLSDQLDLIYEALEKAKVEKFIV
ncbi:MAG: hypothetical protein PHV63_03305 [Candidatus Daviesbacteria bacterium]|nr:hypothetical protein [Candidatus Daviesbacteria bacterium]